MPEPANMPGATPYAYMMLPVRMLAFTFFFTLMYPLVLFLGIMRAIYLRIVVGTPSQILKYGTYPMPKQSDKLPPAGEDGVGMHAAAHCMPTAHARPCPPEPLRLGERR